MSTKSRDSGSRRMAKDTLVFFKDKSINTFNQAG